jgi:predicted small secreted protein
MQTAKQNRRRLVIASVLGVIAAGLSGCSTAGGMASDIGLAGAGGALAYELSDGDIGVTAAGAAGGYLVSKLAQSQVKKAITEAEQRGYDRAMNQAVKQQYWIIQNQQRSFETNQSDSVRLVPVQLPETTVNGVILNPSVEYLRVEP